MSNSRYLFVLLLLLTPNVLAHEIQPAILKLKQAGPQEWRVEFRQPQIQGRFMNLRITTNCTEGALSSVVGSTHLVSKSTLRCLSEPLRSLGVAGIEQTLIDVMVSVVPIDGKPANHLITARSPSLNLNHAGNNVPVYLTLGVEHLAFGLDHVLFVLALLYIVGSFRKLLWVITSFTLAHSITLALATLNLVTVSQGPVEALIALSIIMLAFEALSDEPTLVKQYPWMIAFGFGLLHGLGFAGALKELGLPEGSELTALFLFNVGIELGQLGLVVIALMAVFLLQRSRIPLNHVLTNSPLYAMGGIATYWFLDRSGQILLLSPGFFTG